MVFVVFFAGLANGSAIKRRGIPDHERRLFVLISKSIFVESKTSALLVTSHVSDLHKEEKDARITN
jgi:hypothetical protein